MTMHTIETVTFKLASGISRADFLNTVWASTDFIKKRAGFISRRLSCSDDGTWIEHIEWASLSDAKSASDAFMQDQSLVSFMQCIDGPSAVMRHSQLEVSIS